MMTFVLDYLRDHYWLTVAAPGAMIVATAVVFWGLKCSN